MKKKLQAAELQMYEIIACFFPCPFVFYHMQVYIVGKTACKNKKPIIVMLYIKTE